MADWELHFRVHAVQRMFERGISEVDVRDVLEHGEVIEERPDDLPYPTRLVLGWIDNRPIHVAVSDVAESKTIAIMTVYEPDPGKWSSDFRRRRS